MLEDQILFFKGIKDNLDYTKFFSLAPSFISKFVRETSAAQLANIIYNMGVRTFLYSGVKRRRLEDELGFRIPPYTSFSTSNYCNLSCEGCYVDKKNPKVLSESLLQKIIDESKEIGIHTVAAFGGEPLHPKTRSMLFDSIDNNPGCEYLICTNGTYIDEAVATEISSLKNSYLLVSLDGLLELNDARRGKGTFERVKTAMIELKKRRVFYAMSVTVTSENINEVSSEPFLDFITENGANAIYFHKFMTHDPESEMIPDDEKYQDHIDRLKVLARKMKLMIYDGEFGNLYKKEIIKRSSNCLYVDESGIVNYERNGIPIGDLNTQSLLEMLRTEKVAKIQEFKSIVGSINKNPRNKEEFERLYPQY